jgi:Leucine-rich repeat (LRR) protein
VNLQEIVFSGAASAESCRYKISPFTDAFITFSEPMEIEECIFQLPKLYKLDLSGNAIVGALSYSLEISPSLETIILSNNLISGSLPLSFQNGNVSLLDITRNKITGTWERLAQNVSNSIISMEVNRISGQ